VTTEQLKENLKQVKYPGFSRDIVSFGLVRSAGLAGRGRQGRRWRSTTSDPKIPLHLKAEVEKCLRAIPGVKETLVEIAGHTREGPVSQLGRRQPRGQPAARPSPSRPPSQSPPARAASARARSP
jgi:ATP-binding protein involved in chromosome partitioning